MYILETQYLNLCEFNYRCFYLKFLCSNKDTFKIKALIIKTNIFMIELKLKLKKNKLDDTCEILFKMLNN